MGGIKYQASSHCCPYIVIVDILGKGELTRGHGICFGDIDRNWHTDVLLNVGGFALTDTLLGEMWAEGGYQCDTNGPGSGGETPWKCDEVRRRRCLLWQCSDYSCDATATHRATGIAIRVPLALVLAQQACTKRKKMGLPPQCDSRETPITYLRESNGKGYRPSLAAVRLEGTRSNCNAVGARLTITAGAANLSATGGRLCNARGPFEPAASSLQFPDLSGALQSSWNDPPLSSCHRSG